MILSSIELPRLLLWLQGNYKNSGTATSFWQWEFQCRRHNNKHRVGMPRIRKEHRLYSDSTGRCSVDLCFSFCYYHVQSTWCLWRLQGIYIYFNTSTRLWARGFQLHRRDFKHRLGMPSRRKERRLYSDSREGATCFSFAFWGKVLVLNWHGGCCDVI